MVRKIRGPTRAGAFLSMGSLVNSFFESQGMDGMWGKREISGIGMQDNTMQS
jgi:hypothetical protein